VWAGTPVAGCCDWHITRAKWPPAPTSDISPEPVHLFRAGNEYLFSAYIDNELVFAELREHYEETEYRFEVPVDALETVREQLVEAGFEPIEVTALEPYCVVIERYDEHAAILRQSVATWERRGHRFFLLPDKLAVTDAVDRGATRLEETEFVVGL
jgi:hypothetical protein